MRAAQPLLSMRGMRSVLSLLSLLLLFNASTALADVDPTPCGRTISAHLAATTVVFGALLAPATFGDDFEVRVNTGIGASYRTNITTYDRRPGGALPVLAALEQRSLDAGRATLPTVDWSAMGRRRLGSSRFHYRAWTMNRLVTGGCEDALEASARLVASLSVEAVRTGLFQLELGLGPLFALAAIGLDSGSGRVMLGAAPFARLAVDDPSGPVGAELTLFYLLQPGVDAGLFHGGQLDLTFLMRFPGVTLTATGRGEVNHSQRGLAGTVLMLSGSVLLGVRMPRS